MNEILSFLREAADLTRRIQNDFITPATWEKKDKSPVTVGDLAVQTLVAARLEALYPDVPLIAEESADLLLTDEGKRFLEIILQYVAKYIPDVTAEKVVKWISRGKHDDSLRDAPRFWTLDPIDGTKGFLRKEQYATALALIENGQVTLGFLTTPNLTWLPETKEFTTDQAVGSLICAKRGEGTRVVPLDLGDDALEPIHVSAHADPAEASVLRSVEAGHTNLSQMDVLCQKIGVTRNVGMDSQAKYAMLAAGKSDLLFRLISAKMPDYKEKIWDQAAGSIILEEAGGRVTDLDGKPLDFTQGYTLKQNRGICASNGLLHDRAVQAIEEIGA
ncbi:MAG: 3'(2'),5'-bisphosphate nucleotidase [Thermoguttaceae bacterium]|nr:3'(2'),5'-bisphosphate nucleotidase [Thermoguttaceae bacterium]